MKKALSTLTFFMLLAVVSVTAQCCNSSAQKSDSSQSQQEEVTKASDVKVYYFHATRRCATCQAVEKVTKEALAEKYGDAVSFESINLEEKKNHPLIEKHNVSGQTLLIIKGDKAENLTNYAFMNARTNPDKLKSKIEETIESL
ncbi:nitrophenyl compound nitroreductase subunit ArsF family protein [Anaerophaga thermohalophila]|uniref:nitrophenyl compound nitroreductase subunit ArsF family protein n=1 Tax=Anaerophaga thermohalophila TaxID=177400 RepID=UPI000237C0A1|nr:nitrophenyl compound nitroreductase subunit ArsF family protein [Anaerophaga thermohalophila]